MRLIVPVVAVVVSAPLLFAPAARAQAVATLVPALSVSTVYDDNLFSERRAVGDVFGYLRPSLEGQYESPTVNLQSLISFDIQRSAQHSALNIADARRHATFDGRVRSTPSLVIGLAGAYDRTDTPGDLNIDTGFLLARQRARRLQLTPSASRRLTVRTTVAAQYDWTSEALSGAPSTALHAARVDVAHESSPRTTWSARYLERAFIDDVGTFRSHVGMIGWARELAPTASLSFQAGPRVRSSGGLTAEVIATLIRKTPRSRQLVDYWRGETLVLGIRGPVEVQSGSTTLSWALRRHIDVGTTVGIFNIHTLAATEATVYHTSVVAAWTRAPYIIAASYASDLQHGDIRSGHRADEQVRRGVFLLRLTIAPRLSRAFKPRDDAGDPTTPIRGVLQ